MKIKFQKFEPTSTFLKLFGAGRDKAASDATANEETDAVYEYYYKRGDTYYFRNSAGNKFSIDYNASQKELLRGNKYKIEDISNRKG